MIIGYTKELADYVRKRGKFFASCYSCTSFGSEDACENNNVTSFDIMELEGRVFCPFWRPEQGKDCGQEEIKQQARKRYS